MQLKTIVIMAPLAVLALTGCSKTGTSGESSASVKAEQSHSTEKSLELRHERSAKISVEMPAQVLEVKAFKFYRKELIGKEPLSAILNSPQAPYWKTSYLVLNPFKPKMGWPCNPEQQSWCANFELHFYGRYAVFSNLLLTQLASSIPPSGLVDPASAEASILRAFLAMPKSEFKAAMQDAKESTTGHASANLSGNISGGGNMQFWSGDSTYTGGPTGMTIVKDGVHWFGDGYLSGKKVMVSLDSVINKAGSEKQLLSSMSANETNMSTSSHASTEAEGE